MPGLGSLASGLQSVSSTKRGEIYLIRCDDKGAIDKEPGGARKFQYFPASISDSKAVTYQSREVPGGSLPVYQWTSSGERSISFTVYFTTDIDHMAASPDPLAASINLRTGALDAQAASENTLKVFDNAAGKTTDRLKAAGALERNPFIPGALVWLRQFMLPRYDTASSKMTGVPITFAPRKLWLVIPNSGIGGYGGEGGWSGVGQGIFCHMTQCEVTYESFFPSGNIRHANVSLGFAENAQQGTAVKFPQFGMPNGLVAKAYGWYGLTPSRGTK